MYIYLNIYISADPGLRQGRGGAWDHRRCGACFCWLATTLPSARHSGHCPLLVKGVQACWEQALRPLPSVVKGVQACRLQPKTLRGSFGQALPPLPSVAKGVQACRLPGLKCLKRCAAASSRHSGHCPLLLRAFKPAVCQASNASNDARQLRAGTQATALCC